MVKQNPQLHYRHPQIYKSETSSYLYNEYDVNKKAIKHKSIKDKIPKSESPTIKIKFFL